MKGKDEKQPYVSAVVEVSLFGCTDIVTTSSATDGPYSPDEDLGLWG